MEKSKKMANNIRIEELEKQIVGMGEVVMRLDNSVQILQATVAKDSYFMNENQMLRMQINALIGFNKSLGGTDEAFKTYWEKYKYDYAAMMAVEEKKAREKESVTTSNIIT